MKRKALLTVTLISGMAIGFATFGSTLTGLYYSNQERFCVSCHEMEKPYAEFQATPQYRNRYGIRALCSDCHVP